MEIVIISSPVNAPNEFEVIHQLFDNGLKVFHVRKPNFSVEETEKYLKQIRPAFYKRIVIHNHYNLIGRYDLKGIHLTSYALKGMSSAVIKEIKNVVKQRRLTLSASFHTLQELETPVSYDYVFLSPVFDSISKEGYTAQIDLHQASVVLRNKKSKMKVIALGGVDEDNIDLLQDTGFDGVAMLGAIWDCEDPCEKFTRLKSKYS